MNKGLKLAQPFWRAETLGVKTVIMKKKNEVIRIRPLGLECRNPGPNSIIIIIGDRRIPVIMEVWIKMAPADKGWQKPSAKTENGVVGGVVVKGISLNQ